MAELAKLELALQEEAATERIVEQPVVEIIECEIKQIPSLDLK